MLTDIQIAHSVTPRHISQVAADAGIDEKYLEYYGKYKAKVDLSIMNDLPPRRGKLVLVTAITPTPAGEGKTTTAIGLADGLALLGKKAVLAIREPSLGPVFGIKGGAAGGGYAQVIPMEDVNLHFTGDIHAIGAANNLLAAMLDNHIQQGNALGIDPRTIVWKRCLDINDRQLRQIVDGLGGPKNGVPRQDGFDITVASEVMAALCLASSLRDLKARLARIITAYTYHGRPVTAADLKATGAMTALLRDALKPNLVQTLQGTPAFVHGGPFANIAHGCNSVAATSLAMALGEYTVTEAGFGADLGAEKFIDIKCRCSGIRPDAAIIVATVRALKMHGGAAKTELANEDVQALRAGLPNLIRHIRTIKDVYGLPCAVAVNRFPTDTQAEFDLIAQACAEAGVNAVLSDVWAEGGRGAQLLAQETIRLCGEPSGFRFAYGSDMTMEDKINAVAQKVYGGAGADFTPAARRQAEQIRALGGDKLPVCIAKTQYSFSDDPSKICAPEGFRITVRELRLAAGAGFVIALTGDVLTMPGLPAKPAAENIDVDDDGVISGLF